MAASRLKLVRILQTPTEAEIAHKNAEDKGTFVGWVRMDDTEERESTEEEGESSFVTRAIVKTTEATKRFEKVRFEEAEGGCVGGAEQRA